MNGHGGEVLFLLLEETLPCIQPVEEHRKQLSLAPLSLRKEHCWYLNQGFVRQHRPTEKVENQKISRNKPNIWKCRLTPSLIYLSYSKVRIIITTSCEKHVFIHRAPTVKLVAVHSPTAVSSKPGNACRCSSWLLFEVISQRTSRRRIVTSASWNENCISENGSWRLS